MEEFTASDVRARTFRLTLRGFDRGEVEDYLEQVASYVGALLQQLHQAGVSELGPGATADAAAEYSAAGDEVVRILNEARAAADAMRSRAAAETAAWRNEAETETRHALTETEAAVRQARQSAWDTSTEMLDQVVAQCEAMLAGATESALLVRSEADRESSRLLTDAQRDGETLLRSGREDAERLVNTARREADKMVIASRHQTSVAQERVRALEERRAELMGELEHTQKALLGIEDAAEQPGETPEQIEQTKAEEVPRSRWPEDDGAVKIVAQRRSVASESVDADALVAEVEALRGETPRSLRPAGPADRPPLAASPPTLRSASPSTVEETPESETETELKPGSETALEPEPETAAEPEPDHVQEPESEQEPGPDPLAGLFDELRTNGNGGVVGEGFTGQSATDESPPGRVAVIDEVRPGAQRETLDSGLSTLDSTIDPFALRDRLLLPVQNQALRSVKRQLVSAQNRALEELRLDEAWTPDITLVDGEIGGVLVSVAEESMAAGFAAAAELLGRSDAPHPEIHIDDPTVEFTRVFVDAAALSLERSRSAGAGKRETASSLSRVFRAWRTDDAERRVRFLSRRAYQQGVLDGLQAMDCHQVSVIPSNRTCVDCGQGSDPWPIADGPPPGTLIPPASLECSCTVVPAC